MQQELKAGMWIAQGSETNILIRVAGASPMLEIIGAMDLNSFYRTGEIKQLEKDSIEVIDIQSCPEKYRFEKPTITDAIKSAGIDTTSGKKLDEIKDEELKLFLNKYQELISLYHNTQNAETRFIVWLKQNHGYAISQGKFVISKIKKLLNQPV